MFIGLFLLYLFSSFFVKIFLFVSRGRLSRYTSALLCVNTIVSYRIVLTWDPQSPDTCKTAKIVTFLGEGCYVTFALRHEPSVCRLWRCCMLRRDLNYSTIFLHC